MEFPDHPRFYIPEVLPGEFILEGEEAKHAKVLRVQEGDAVHVVDGKGQLYEGIAHPAKKHLRISDLRVVWKDEGAMRSGITMGVAPTKNIARFEWVIEKAVEIGVDRIVPLITEHSERTRLRVDRLERIAVSAMKQSKALWMTRIDEAISLDEFLPLEQSHKWIAHCHEEPQKENFHTLTSISPKESLALLIGPEGDFSLNEVKKAEALGWQGLDLGPKRLRTETAAITAIIAAGIMRR